VTDLRASRDHTVVLSGALERARISLLGVWRDRHAQAFDLDVLVPLQRETDALARAIAEADREIDVAFRALRGLGAHI
jgi:hypothetical protein